LLGGFNGPSNQGLAADLPDVFLRNALASTAGWNHSEDHKFIIPKIGKISVGYVLRPGKHSWQGSTYLDGSIG